jgi:hypothetical protein
MRFLQLLCLASFIPTSSLHADWQATGDPKAVTISGDAASINSSVTLDVPASAKPAAARFGPIRIDAKARALNLRTEVDSAIPKHSKFRLTVVLTSEAQFPADPTKQLTRSNHIIQPGENGPLWVSVAMPKAKPPGNSCNAFIEIASGELDRSGKPGPATPGRLTVRGIDLLASTLPATTGIDPRRAAFLEFLGRNTLAGSVGRVTTKSALRLPGLLAAISTVKSTQDPRLDRFIAENITIVKAMRTNNLRIGPFEIFFPIANFVAAKRLLGPTLTSHPRYAEYQKTIFDFQCSWPDYKSNADSWPKRPIREAKSISDVPASIDTGNFRLLVTAAGYLSAQEFPNLQTTLTDPKSGKQQILTREVIQREMNLYLRRVYHSIACNNTWEYGSQTYLAIDFAPIHLIALHAKDPEIRRIAANTLDCLYSSLAASMNRGHYINSAGRSKGEFLGTGSGMGFLGWLMFGDGRSSDAMTTPFLAYTALPGSYQVPPAIRPAQEFPFVKREKIGSGENFVCIYTYQSKSFGLTSTIESRSPASRNKPGWDRDSFYKEAARHKLNWTTGSCGGFVPQWQNSAQPYAARRNKPNGNYYGLNPWSQVAQHKGTQIGLADVDAGYPFRQLYTIYPANNSIRKRVFHPQSGWTICHTGGTLFAFRSLKPATQSAEAWPDRNSVTDRFDYKKTAWILEAVDAPTTPTPKSETIITEEIARFHAKLQSAKVQAEHLDDTDPSPPKFSYTSPISNRTLHLDAAVYPSTTDGSGMQIQDYPVLATYPESPNSPSVRQSNQELLWLDSKSSPILKHVFADWLK